mmetsp:Transcript_22344/g.84774  ORF Transcript_22344/g.84774 Transcript_22344/m.84774 type:complete len:229 (-) Transcript_22344:529-1215(-)
MAAEPAWPLPPGPAHRTPGEAAPRSESAAPASPAATARPGGPRRAQRRPWAPRRQWAQWQPWAPLPPRPPPLWRHRQQSPPAQSSHASPLRPVCRCRPRTPPAPPCRPRPETTRNRPAWLRAVARPALPRGARRRGACRCRHGGRQPRPCSRGRTHPPPEAGGERSPPPLPPRPHRLPLDRRRGGLCSQPQQCRARSGLAGRSNLALPLARAWRPLRRGLPPWTSSTA